MKVTSLLAAFASSCILASSAEVFDALDWLVAPLNSSTFFSDYFEQQPLHVRQREQSQIASLFSSALLDEVLEEGLKVSNPLYYLNNQRFRLVKKLERDGEDWTAILPPSVDAMTVEKAHEAFMAGFSVLINGLEVRWLSVQNAAMFIEELTGIRTRVNLYFTPPGKQAFDAHFDSMDGFVVQIEGSKEWIIYEPLMDRPRSDMKYKPKREELKELQRIILEPGDVLYIPRGWPHEAIAVESELSLPSLHLTFGIETAVETSCEALLHALVDVIDWDAEAGFAFDSSSWAPWTAADALHVAIAAFGGDKDAKGSSLIRSAAPIFEGFTTNEDLQLKLLSAVESLQDPGELRLADWACRLGNRSTFIDPATGEVEAYAALDGAGEGQRAYVMGYFSSALAQETAPQFCAQENEAFPKLGAAAALAKAGEKGAADAVEAYRAQLQEMHEARALFGRTALEVLQAGKEMREDFLED